MVSFEYTFTREDTEIAVPIEVYSDNEAEGPETFYICLPNLEVTNMDVMMVNDIQPNCITVHIIDNDSKKLIAIQSL